MGILWTEQDGLKSISLASSAFHTCGSLLIITQNWQLRKILIVIKAKPISNLLFWIMIAYLES